MDTAIKPGPSAIRTPLEATLSAIDAANEADPTLVVVKGVPSALALAEGRSAFAWARRLRAHASASDALLIATRGHHIRRWETPRDSYPRTRAGYQAWRSRLYDVHAKHLADLMRAAGYGDAEVEAMSAIVHRRAIKTDADAQTYEDAVALAFLEIQFAPFAARTERDTVLRALRRTWSKMSDRGREAALALPLSPELRVLMEDALAAAATGASAKAGEAR